MPRSGASGVNFAIDPGEVLGDKRALAEEFRESVLLHGAHALLVAGRVQLPSRRGIDKRRFWRLFAWAPMSLPPDSGPAETPVSDCLPKADLTEAEWYATVYQGDNVPQLTWRAVVTGGVLGMLMASANLYTTLKIGWAFGVGITA